MNSWLAICLSLDKKILRLYKENYLFCFIWEKTNTTKDTCFTSVALGTRENVFIYAFRSCQAYGAYVTVSNHFLSRALNLHNNYCSVYILWICMPGISLQLCSRLASSQVQWNSHSSSNLDTRFCSKYLSANIILQYQFFMDYLMLKFD